jgi:hypothetical protein
MSKIIVRWPILVTFIPVLCIFIFYIYFSIYKYYEYNNIKNNWQEQNAQIVGEISKGNWIDTVYYPIIQHSCTYSGKQIKEEMLYNGYWYKKNVHYNIWKKIVVYCYDYKIYNKELFFNFNRTADIIVFILLSFYSYLLFFATDEIIQKYMNFLFWLKYKLWFWK